MERKDSSESGLPDTETRRQILERAGVVLKEAREVLARLEREQFFPGEVQRLGSSRVHLRSRNLSVADRARSNGAAS